MGYLIVSSSFICHHGKAGNTQNSWGLPSKTLRIMRTISLRFTSYTSVWRDDEHKLGCTTCLWESDSWKCYPIYFQEILSCELKLSKKKSILFLSILLTGDNNISVSLENATLAMYHILCSLWSAREDAGCTIGMVFLDDICHAQVKQFTKAPSKGHKIKNLIKKPQKYN